MLVVQQETVTVLCGIHVRVIYIRFLLILDGIYGVRAWENGWRISGRATHRKPVSWTSPVPRIALSKQRFDVFICSSSRRDNVRGKSSKDPNHNGSNKTNGGNHESSNECNWIKMKSCHNAIVDALDYQESKRMRETK